MKIIPFSRPQFSTQTVPYRQNQLMVRLARFILSGNKSSQMSWESETQNTVRTIFQFQENVQNAALEFNAVEI